MNLSWLEDFAALAATGNFSRAAAERHMTQPAFSRRIRALEEWLGVELFDRSSQPVRLTTGGVWFRQVAQELVARVARLPGEAQAVAEARSNTLRFAATHALSFTFLPGWLRELEERVRIGPVQLVSDVQPRCEALLLQREVHFVLSHVHPRVRGPLAGHPSVLVGADRLLPVAAVGEGGKPVYRLGEGRQADFVPILAYALESGLGAVLHALHGRELERRQAQAKAVFVAQLASALRSMALAGRGLAWLPERLIADDLAQGRLALAAAERWIVELEIRLQRDRAALGPGAEAFWSACVDADSRSAR